MKEISKAIIMAGGEGTRLSPITDRMPKPLVPILNIPAISRILKLLYRHGIREAAVTVKYRAGDLIQYYQTHDSEGVKLCFFAEGVPLGTAGGVKAASDFLDSDFLVVSGDAVCDFNLTEALRYHTAKGALATIVTTQKTVPLAFGGVVCAPNGEITQFVEKPSWHGVLSDSVNTGIYVFDRRILAEIPENTFCDFSRDLFPRLIGKGLYGYTAHGYWCDVGSLDAYYDCNRDALAGRIGGITPHGGENELAADAVIAEDALVRGGTIAGNVKIGKGAIIDASILMDGVMIGDGAVVRESIVCRNAVIGKRTIVRRGSVIGESAVIADGVILENRTHVDAGKMILLEDLIVENQIFSGAEGNLFREFGIAGNVKTELTPPFLTRYGAAAVSVMGRRAMFFDDGTPSANYVKNLMMSGAVSTGADCTDGGSGFFSLAAFSVSYSGCDYAVYVKQMTGDIHKVYVLDRYGFPLGTPRSRRIAAEMKKHYEVSLPSVTAHEDDTYGDYLHYLVDNAKPLRGKLAIAEGACGEAFYAAATLLGAIAEVGTKSMAADGYVFVNISDDGELEISYRTTDGGYVMIDRWHATAALIKSKIAGGENVIYLPVTAPRALDDTVRTLGGIVKRYDTETDMDSEALAAASGQTWQNDTVLLALLFAAELGAERRIYYAGEEFALAEKTLTVDSAAAVLGELVAHGAITERGTVVLNFDDASVRVTAEDEHTVKLAAEAKSPRDAEDAIHYAEKGITVAVPEA